MAEKRKIVEGFVHNVSPIKLSKSNRKYFDGQIQTATEKYSKIVCFDIRKHGQISEAEKAKRSLQFQDVKESLNLRDSTRTDYIIHEKTMIEVQKVPFKAVKFNEPGQSTLELNINNIDTTPDHNKVTITAHVAYTGEETVQNVRGTLLKKKTITVADHTASCNVTLWASHVNEVECHKTYTFTNLKVRTIESKKTLTSTPGSTIIPAENLTNVIPVSKQDQVEQTKAGKILMVCAKESKTCFLCKKAITVQEDENIVRCPNCEMKQKKDLLVTNCHITITVKFDEEIEKLTIFSSVLSTFLVIKQKEHLMDNMQLTENFLLEIDTPLVFTFNKDKIVTKINIPVENPASPPFGPASPPFELSGLNDNN